MPKMPIEAAFRKKGRVIEYLLENEKNWVWVNSVSTVWCSREWGLTGTMTALWVACYTDNISLVEWLIGKEADVQLSGDQKPTPLGLIEVSAVLRPHVESLLPHHTSTLPSVGHHTHLNVEQRYADNYSCRSSVDMSRSE